MSSPIILWPVGRICSEKECFSLEIHPPFAPALAALDGFSHIQVLWWAHGSDTRQARAVTAAKAPYKDSPERVGIFATRAETRPNPVMLTTAAVMGIDTEKGRVALSWIDAAHNSPVIDIKPYQPCLDRVREVGLPEWCAGWPQWLEDSGRFDWSKVFNF